MSNLRAGAAPFIPSADHLVFTIQLGTSCGASVVASDYSAPSSPRSVVGSSLADDHDLEAYVTPCAKVCPQLRKVGKKLAQIEQLKAKQAAGAELDTNQLAKVQQEPELRAQQSHLERGLEGRQAEALAVLGRASTHAGTMPAVSREHQRGSRTRARAPARSADGRAMPRTQRFSLLQYVDRAEAAPPSKADALKQLDQKVATARAAEDAKQGWVTVHT